MSDHHVWLSDAQFANKVRGGPRVDDRTVISGIIHVIRNGLRWRDAPACDGPHKTLYNRFIRWSMAGVFDRIFHALAADRRASGTLMIDSPHLKAHRTAASLLKKGLLSATLDAPEEVSTPNSTPSATGRAGLSPCT